MIKYGVAYLNKDNKGFSKTEPWVLQCNSIDDAISRAGELIAIRCFHVTPFEYEYNINAQDDCVTWDYVENHKLWK